MNKYLTKIASLLNQRIISPRNINSVKRFSMKRKAAIPRGGIGKDSYNDPIKSPAMAGNRNKVMSV